MRKLLTLTLILALSVMVAAQGQRRTESKLRSFDVRGGTVHDGTSIQSALSPRKDYASVIEMPTGFIESEMADKELAALSIALLDDQQIVWSKGFGFANPKDKEPVTDETIYRVGSVSKLFTDIAIMQLVEQRKLDLDAPGTRYLPEFHPRNSFGKAITLRQLMSHRSGVVREAVIRLVVSGPAGQRQEIEAVIDTGFTGSLSIPTALITLLNLPFRRRGRALLADGSETIFDTYEAGLLWDGQVHRVAVVPTKNYIRLVNR